MLGGNMIIFLLGLLTGWVVLPNILAAVRR